MNDSRELTPIPVAAPNPAAAGVVPSAEDTGSQALSEALRSSFLIVKILLIGVVIYFFCSGIFKVGSEEKAVILRFGKPMAEGEKALLEPGLHFAFPAPIDEIVRIPIREEHTVSSTVGWYTTTAAQEAARNEPPPRPFLDPASDGYLLTGDGNIVHIRATLRYRISEPGLNYTFDFVQTSNLVQNFLNNALFHAASAYKIQSILTADVVGFREAVQKRLERSVEEQHVGVVIDQIELQAIPPRQLSADFLAVLQAGIESSKAVNEANQYANQTMSRAKAESENRINSSKAEQGRLVEFVAAEAKLFNELLPEYRKYPGLFVQQQQTETLKRVMNNAQDRWVLPKEAGGKPTELRLQLNREPGKPKSQESKEATGHS